MEYKALSLAPVNPLMGQRNRVTLRKQDFDADFQAQVPINEQRLWLKRIHAFYHDMMEEASSQPPLALLQAPATLSETPPGTAITEVSPSSSSSNLPDNDLKQAASPLAETSVNLNEQLPALPAAPVPTPEPAPASANIGLDFLANLFSTIQAPPLGPEPMPLPPLTNKQERLLNLLRTTVAPTTLYDFSTMLGNQDDGLRAHSIQKGFKSLLAGIHALCGGPGLTTTPRGPVRDAAKDSTRAAGRVVQSWNQEARVAMNETGARAMPPSPFLLLQAPCPRVTPNTHNTPLYALLATFRCATHTHTHLLTCLHTHALESRRLHQVSPRNPTSLECRNSTFLPWLKSTGLNMSWSKRLSSI